MIVSQKRRSISASIPAPVGGWNARDSLGDMAPTDAVSMTNWYPGTSDVMVRGGYTQYATGMVDQVETIMPYAGGGTNELFAAAGTSIFDITAGGAVGAADVTGLTNARFQYINVATSGGNFMMCVNGADKLQGYNGSAWYEDGDGTHDITGVDTADCIQINLFKNRVWLIKKDSLNAYYLPTSAIAGAAVAFPLQGIASQGGYIMAMATWTIDAGYGVDDLAVFITSMGEVIVYKGTDPASSTTWALVGVWSMGAPVGRRCFTNYAGDLIMISQDGLVPMSGALQSSRTNPKVALTDKIQYAVSEAITEFGTNFGWQVLFYPKANAVYLNVPIAVGSQQQFVMNSITKAWCNFQGWNANCWALFGDNPYFGSAGFVGRANYGTSDNNTNINADALQAYNYFGSHGLLKRWTMMRPTLRTNGLPAILSNVNVDFNSYDPSSNLAYTPGTTFGVWDSAVWDQSSWDSELSTLAAWQGVTGVGYCAGARLKSASQGIKVHWVATDFVYEVGAIL